MPLFIQSLVLMTAQIIVLLAVSPFLVGLIRKVKASCAA
jgi:formate hydrogenlyase subunit 4